MSGGHGVDVQVRAVMQAAQAVASSLDLDEILHTIVDQARAISGAPVAWLYLFEEETQLLRYRTGGGVAHELDQTLTIPLGQGLSGRVAATGEPLNVVDARGEVRILYPEHRARYGLVSYLGLPVKLGARLLGVLTFNGYTPRAYSQEEIACLEIFAQHAAVAIENARLYRQERARREQLEAVRAVGAEITRELNVTTLLALIQKRSMELVGAAAGVLYVWEEAPQMLRPCAWTGFSDGIAEMRLGLGDGVVGTVAQRREGLLVNDYQHSSLALPFVLESTQATAALAEPLVCRGRLLGVIVANHREGRRFAAEDQRVLRLFADQAAIALENARLYLEVRGHAATLEQRVQDRTRELKAANARLAAASHYKSEFLANMSHEIRTPLNSIIGFSELLLNEGVGPLNGRQQRFLWNIHRSGQHLLQLINDILDLSKVEAGKLVLQPETLATAQALEDILVIARGLANRKAQTIEADIPPELPHLRADPVRFKQICFNLLSNAVKFTPEGGRITVRARRISDFRLQIADLGVPPLQSEISNRKSAIPDDFLEIVVQDTGVGIRPEDLPKLFGEFVQLETTRAQRHEGTGLGLALTKRLVEMHDGRIDASSAGEGRGSMFRVQLPVRGPGEPPP